MNSDNPNNWVEALTRVLTIPHDLVNPSIGLSPYQMFFGRERPVGGFPTEITTRFPESDAFMDHIAELDKTSSKTLNEELQKQENQLKKNRKQTIDFRIGEWVWILFPTAISGPKLQSFWIGPFKVN